MESGKTILYPIRRRYMWVVVRTPWVICMLVIPSSPSVIIYTIVISVFRKAIGLVIEHTFLYSVLVFCSVILNTTPERFMDKACEFIHMALITLNVLLHHRC